MISIQSIRDMLRNPSKIHWGHQNKRMKRRREEGEEKLKYEKKIKSENNGLSGKRGDQQGKGNKRAVGVNMIKTYLCT